MESNNNNKYKLIQLSEHYIEYLIPLCTIKLFHFLLYFTSSYISLRTIFPIIDFHHPLVLSYKFIFTLWTRRYILLWTFSTFLLFSYRTHFLCISSECINTHRLFITIYNILYTIYNNPCIIHFFTK